MEDLSKHAHSHLESTRTTWGNSTVENMFWGSIDAVYDCRSVCCSTRYAVLCCVVCAAAAVIDLLDRTDFPDNLGREWIFVRMHDAIVRSLATMVSLGYPIKPASAIHSSAVSPRRLQVRGQALRGCRR